jgi:hypothetical protein
VVALQSTLLAKRLKAPEPIKSCLPAFTTGAFLVCPISDSHFVGTALFSAHVASRPVPHQKTNAAHPHQGRWHAAHRLGCPDVYARPDRKIGSANNGSAPASCYLPKPILTLSARSSSWRCSTMPSSIFLSTHEPLVRAARERLEDAARILLLTSGTCQSNCGYCGHSRNPVLELSPFRRLIAQTMPHLGQCDAIKARRYMSIHL